MSPNRIPTILAAGLAIAALVGGCSHEPTAADKTPEGVEYTIREVYETVRSGPVYKEDWLRYCAEMVTEDSQSAVHYCREGAEDDSGITPVQILRIEDITIDGDVATANVDVKEDVRFRTYEEEFHYEEGRWKRVAHGSYR